MGRSLILWVLGLALLWLLVLALAAVLPYLIGGGIIIYIGYRIHLALVRWDEKNQLE